MLAGAEELPPIAATVAPLSLPTVCGGMAWHRDPRDHCGMALHVAAARVVSCRVAATSAHGHDRVTCLKCGPLDDDAVLPAVCQILANLNPWWSSVR